MAKYAKKGKTQRAPLQLVVHQDDIVGKMVL